MKKAGIPGRSADLCRAKVLSVGVDACGLDGGCETCHFRLDKLLVLGGFHPFVGHHHSTQAFLFLDEFRVFQSGLEGGVEFLQNRRWCGCEGKESVAVGCLDDLYTGFLQCWQVFQH